jgi:hypothetical protein
VGVHQHPADAGVSLGQAGGLTEAALAPGAAAQRLHERLAALALSLAARDDALALLALGSVGVETERLDAWSDLDFFVLVRKGAKPRYLAQLDWLAAAHPVAWHFPNTVDGHKALMADGVFCEFAVFELHELAAIPYAPGRWVWRRDDVDEALARSPRPLPAPPTADWLVGEALSNLVVGLQRHARGERLAALRLVQVFALDRLLEFLEQREPASCDARIRRDPYSVDRRVELRCSPVVAALPRWAGGYDATVPAALGILVALEQHGVVPRPVAEHIRALAAAAERAGAD